MSNFRNGKRFSDILTILLVIVIIAIICLLGYFGYKAVSKRNIQSKTSNAVDRFNDAIADSNKNEVEEPPVNNDSVNLDNFINTAQTQQPNTNNNNNKNPKKTYLDGFEIKGTLKIRKTGINYPVLDSVSGLSKSLAILDIVGCDQITTKVTSLNVPGTNAYILGHNYKNGLFFSDNYKLAEGDTIEITDQMGETVTYKIYKTYFVNANDVSFMEREIEPNVREITLQTCSDDVNERLIILAKDS